MPGKQDNPFLLPDNTPEKAPVPRFDPGDANYFDMFAPQFYNLETVQTLMKEGGGPLLLKIVSVDVEYVFNPERGEDSGEWKPVIHFANGGPALVVNRTRARTLMDAAGSIQVKDWSRVGWLEVAVGIENGQAQIVIQPSANSHVGDEPGSQMDADGSPKVDMLNEELFD
jgi:hypothetical protein